VSARAVVVAHRAAMVAEGIAAALARYPGIVPIAVATTAAEGERAGLRADAVAMDMYLEGGELAAARLRRRGVRVVFLGDSPDPEGDGMHVSTRSSVASLASALVPDASPSKANGARLTPRERQVVSLITRGLPAKQVARHLGISPKTVEQHKSRIFAKLGVRNQVGAVRVVLSEGRNPQEDVWNRSSM
jgi:DNA-binding NarL/FixJ family response regulator